MEKIILKRTDCTDQYTLGELWYNDSFVCYTLEDPIRDIKIKHMTAIPYGTYKIIINFSQRFKQLMPLLLNVPNFVGIRIHKGNFTYQTSGCLLVGTEFSNGKLLRSNLAYTKVFNLIKKILKTNELQIEIINTPKPTTYNNIITTIKIWKNYFRNL